MSENQKILDRLAKLMRLAESTTHEGEKQAAWERINHLLTEHRLEMSDVQQEKAEVINYQYDLTSYSPARRWRLALLFAVSEYLPVTVLYAGSVAWVYCLPKERELFDFFYASVSNQLTRAAKMDCRKFGIPTFQAQKWRAQYISAAVDVVRVRFTWMRQAQRQALLDNARGERALVLLDADRAEVQTFVDEVIKPKRGVARRDVEMDELAYETGRAAGRAANLNAGLTS